LLWVGFILLCWKWRPARYTLLAITAAAGAFLALPGGPRVAPAALRAEYVAGLRRYDGVAYVWGGKNWRGIDCSGLIRRGLVDALFLRGLRTCDPGLVRSALRLWWNDTTAKAFGEGQGQWTTSILEVPSINEMDASRLKPGDLAVTRSGVHIMAYIGEGQWMEADPLEARVMMFSVPATANWFQIPMRIVRWKILAEE
jgi:cell wall-associated NlpC family hydrolase